METNVGPQRGIGDGYATPGRTGVTYRHVCFERMELARKLEDAGQGLCRKTSNPGEFVVLACQCQRHRGYHGLHRGEREGKFPDGAIDRGY